MPLDRLSERCEFLVDCLDLPAASGVDDARWERFQLDLFNDDAIFRIENKSRQIAWSFSVAAEAVAEAVLYGTSSAFVSINLEEAAEKIRYARAVYENLQVARLPKLTRDNAFTLGFANNARILSLPARPPRGKARFNVYLDEFAHVQYDRQIYTAALPIISKGGRLRIGSSPMGAVGVFWEVFSERLRPYPGYMRRATPWWDVFAFSLDPALARAVAPTVPTDERVARFGNDRIKTIYANMVLEDFRQEYECEFVDEVTSWFTWDEIKAVTDATLRCRFAKKPEDVPECLARLEEDLRAGRIESVFYGGMDIGRTRNTTELFLLGASTTGSFPLRACITLDAQDYDTQLDVICQVLGRLPVAKLFIDCTGLGGQLAESAYKRFPIIVEGQNFTAGAKTLWATDAKMYVQQRRVVLPPDRDLAYQIHSIKRLVTASKNLVFDTDANEKHHADKFWAWALALGAARRGPASITIERVPEALAGYVGQVTTVGGAPSFGELLARVRRNHGIAEG